MLRRLTGTLSKWPPISFLLEVVSARLERKLLRVKVFYHDRCFDGASSAALFSRFYAERIRDDVEFVYSGLLHREGALFNEADFDGDENAIVGFKYARSRNIT